MLWGRRASIGHRHVDRSRQECMCAMQEDGQTLLSPAQKGVSVCQHVCCIMIAIDVAAVVIAVLLPPLLELMSLLLGERA
jgi:hypothetical protein